MSKHDKLVKRFLAITNGFHMGWTYSTAIWLWIWLE